MAHHRHGNTSSLLAARCERKRRAPQREYLPRKQQYSDVHVRKEWGQETPGKHRPKAITMPSNIDKEYNQRKGVWYHRRKDWCHQREDSAVKKDLGKQRYLKYHSTRSMPVSKVSSVPTDERQERFSRRLPHWSPRSNEYLQKSQKIYNGSRITEVGNWNSKFSSFRQFASDRVRRRNQVPQEHSVRASSRKSKSQKRKVLEESERKRKSRKRKVLEESGYRRSVRAIEQIGRYSKTSKKTSYVNENWREAMRSKNLIPISTEGRSAMCEGQGADLTACVENVESKLQLMKGENDLGENSTLTFVGRNLSVLGAHSTDAYSAEQSNDKIGASATVGKTSYGSSVPNNVANLSSTEAFNTYHTSVQQTNQWNTSPAAGATLKAINEKDSAFCKSENDQWQTKALPKQVDQSVKNLAGKSISEVVSEQSHRRSSYYENILSDSDSSAMQESEPVTQDLHETCESVTKLKNSPEETYEAISSASDYSTEGATDSDECPKNDFEDDSTEWYSDSSGSEGSVCGIPHLSTNLKHQAPGSEKYDTHQVLRNLNYAIPKCPTSMKSSSVSISQCCYFGERTELIVQGNVSMPTVVVVGSKKFPDNDVATDLSTNLKNQSSGSHKYDTHQLLRNLNHAILKCPVSRKNSSSLPQCYYFGERTELTVQGKVSKPTVVDVRYTKFTEDDDAETEYATSTVDSDSTDIEVMPESKNSFQLKVLNRPEVIDLTL